MDDLDFKIEKELRRLELLLGSDLRPEFSTFLNLYIVFGVRRVRQLLTELYQDSMTINEAIEKFHKLVNIVNLVASQNRIGIQISIYDYSESLIDGQVLLQSAQDGVQLPHEPIEEVDKYKIIEQRSALLLTQDRPVIRVAVWAVPEHINVVNILFSDLKNVLDSYGGFKFNFYNIEELGGGIEELKNNIHKIIDLIDINLIVASDQFVDHFEGSLITSYLKISYANSKAFVILFSQLSKLQYVVDLEINKVLGYECWWNPMSSTPQPNGVDQLNSRQWVDFVDRFAREVYDFIRRDFYPKFENMEPLRTILPFRYSQFEVIADVGLYLSDWSHAINDKDMLVVLGDAGAGKSTLLKSMFYQVWAKEQTSKAYYFDLAHAIPMAQPTAKFNLNEILANCIAGGGWSNTGTRITNTEANVIVEMILAESSKLKTLFIVDNLDALLIRLTDEDAAKCISQLSLLRFDRNFAQERNGSKLLIGCRSNYFIDASSQFSFFGNPNSEIEDKDNLT
jgi:hypothetical protein